MINNNIDVMSTIGKKSWIIFNGLSPKLVITISSYSLDSFDKLNAKDIKKDIGSV